MERIAAGPLPRLSHDVKALPHRTPERSALTGHLVSTKSSIGGWL